MTLGRAISVCWLCLLLTLPAAAVQPGARKKSAKTAASQQQNEDSRRPAPQPTVIDLQKTVATTPWGVVALLTALSLIPAVLLAMTPFVRLLVVFHFLRQALGTQTIPTNQTLIGLALFLTYFVMQPVVMDVYKTAVVPMQAGKMEIAVALDKGATPVKNFMLKYAREKDLALFVELAKEPAPKTPRDLSMRVVIPSYIISELKAGFQIGAVLFLPFLVIDMVVASITTSMGMMQLPPVVISTPLKILIFVMADGWNLLVGSILRSFY